MADIVADDSLSGVGRTVRLPSCSIPPDKFAPIPRKMPQVGDLCTDLIVNDRELAPPRCNREPSGAAWMYLWMYLSLHSSTSGNALPS